MHKTTTTSPASAPLIAGLEVFEVTVNGDDPRWSRISAEEYVSCDERFARPEHFFMKPGPRIVRYVLLEFGYDPKSTEVVRYVIRYKLSLPDRATVETILDARKGECDERPILGFCVLSSVFDKSVGAVFEVASRRFLVGLVDPCRLWARRLRFVALVSEELLQV